MSRALTIALSTLGVILAMSYPVLVYLGLSRLETRTLALGLLALLLPTQLLRVRGRRREQLASVLALPLGLTLLLLLAALINDQRLVLALPVLISSLLLASFAATLRAGRTPIIERFARMQVEELSAEEVRYCRRVTQLWCAFFTANGLIALSLALAGPLSLWTLYNGGLSYGAIGLLLSAEYVYRKWRFRRFGQGWSDRRIFARLFPQAAVTGRGGCASGGSTAPRADGS